MTPAPVRGLVPAPVPHPHNHTYLMIWLIARRLLEAIPLLFVVSTALFFLVHLVPGSPAIAVLGSAATPASIEAFNASVGLDRPLGEQYADFMLGLLQGQVGQSWISRAPVAGLVFARLPITITLAIAATVLSLIIGVLIGMLAATRGRVLDRVITAVSGLGIALPSFWVAVLLVLVFAIWLRILPATGWVEFRHDPSAWLRHLALPVLALVIIQIAGFARQTRAAVLGELSRDYVRALKARGLGRTRILWRHVLRNASIPVATTIGLTFVSMLSGAVIVEQVFAIPGIGLMTVQAANSHDLPVLQGVVLFTAIVIVLVNLAVDVLYGILSPKLRRR